MFAGGPCQPREQETHMLHALCLYGLLAAPANIGAARGPCGVTTPRHDTRRAPVPIGCGSRAGLPAAPATVRAATSPHPTPPMAPAMPAAARYLPPRVPGAARAPWGTGCPRRHTTGHGSGGQPRHALEVRVGQGHPKNLTVVCLHRAQYSAEEPGNVRPGISALIEAGRPHSFTPGAHEAL